MQNTSTISDGKRIIIIPARMKSSRFPGKPLAEVTAGVTLVDMVYARAKQTDADHVIVATPDREVAKHCQDRNMLWRPTSEDHTTGTHRCAEVLGQLKEGLRVKTVVNWQVDEPLVPVDAVNRLMDLPCLVGTLISRARPSLVSNPNVTKVVVSEANLRCMWFSRAPMLGSCLHWGIYVFSPAALSLLGNLQPTALSQAEQLEQLAWIEHGYTIHGLLTEQSPFSINTPDDLELLKSNEDH